DRKAEIFRLEQVRATDLDALARWQEQISVKVGSNTSSILEVKEAQATYEAASAKQISQVKADVDSVTGRVTQVETATATLTEAQAKFERSTIAQFEEHKGYITNIETTVSNIDFTVSETLLQLSAEQTSIKNEQLKSKAEITENRKAIATETEARTEMGVQMKTGFANTESAITEIKETQSEQDKTIAKTTEQLRSEIKMGDEKLQGDIDKQGRELSKISSSVDEQKTAIAELDKTQTELKQTQQSNYEENNAHIANLQQTIANSDSANAEAIMQTTAQTTLNHNENLKVKASVERQQKVLANQQEAHAELSEKVDAQYADNQATIVEIKKSVAEQGQSQAEKTEQLRAELKKDIDDNTEEINKTNSELSSISAIVTNNTKAIATTNKTVTENEQKATSRFENNEASLANIQNTQANADSSQAESTLQLSVQQNQQGTELLRAKASIRETNKIVADNDKAYTQKFTQLDSQHEQTNARFTQIEETLADAQQSIVETKEQLQGEILTVDGRVSAVDQKVDRTKVTLENAIAESSQTLDAKVESAQGTANKAKTDAANAQQEIDKYKNSNDQRMIIAETQITSNKQAIANEQETRGSQINKINSELGGLNAAFEAQAKTYVDQKGNASSIFGIKNAVVVNGQYYEAQMILGAEVKNGEVTTQIGFSADTFGIFNPASGKLEPVFFVENGQVFINEAFINQATIEKLLIGSTIKSKNWDPATKKGLMLDFENGKLIANDAEITGKIYATDGEFNGTVYVEKLTGDVSSTYIIAPEGTVIIEPEKYDRVLICPSLSIARRMDRYKTNGIFAALQKNGVTFVRANLGEYFRAGADSYDNALYAATPGVSCGSVIIKANERASIKYVTSDDKWLIPSQTTLIVIKK
ncbi:phage tail tip fiber protein, partial [Providencia sp. PROV157]|uniref:phage tail tip fiber protein n=1 Tax=Providencia sp. PROV157 TaxID=2949867 RepID=UPI00234B8658